MTEDLHSLRRRLKAALPGRIEDALAGYERFAAAAPPEDAKGFTAWHGAAKAALAHVDLLLKLARWAEGKGDDPGAEDGLDRLLAQARAALTSLEEDEP